MARVTSSSGTLPVVRGTPINPYNEVTGVAMAASQTVLTYTVPIGMTLTLTRVDLSSDSICTVELDINNTANAKQRLSYGFYNISFQYGDLTLVAGTVVTIVATNNSLQGSASFNATLQGTIA